MTKGADCQDNRGPEQAGEKRRHEGYEPEESALQFNKKGERTIFSPGDTLTQIAYLARTHYQDGRGEDDQVLPVQAGSDVVWLSGSGRSGWGAHNSENLSEFRKAKANTAYKMQGHLRCDMG